MTTKPKTVVELFEGHPERWTQGTFSKDAAGNITHISSPHTMCWCLTGAIWFVYDNLEFGNAVSRTTEAIKKLHHYHQDTIISLASWQDQPERTFEEVFAVAKEAKI